MSPYNAVSRLKNEIPETKLWNTFGGREGG